MKICAVVVTFNRLDCLKTALDALCAQERGPDAIVIVDNNSSDGTDVFLNEWITRVHSFEVVRIRMPENVGGAGGFRRGFQAALAMNCDWVLVSDDDAYPTPSYLNLLCTYVTDSANVEGLAPPSVVAGAVMNHGSVDTDHRRMIRRGLVSVRQSPSRLEDYSGVVPFPIDGVSYVGALVRASALWTVGVTDDSFFIHYDDTEHSLRLARCGPVVCVPAAVIHHDVDYVPRATTWKSYYSVRNRLLMLRRHYPSRYSWWAALKEYIRKVSVLARIVGHRTHEERRLFREAVRDGLHGRSGEHALYRPGWRLSDSA
jgi:GT2 family glycosyltransferase